MEIVRVQLDQLIPAPYNPRRELRPGDPEYEALRRSITEFGLVEPLVWNRRTGRLVGGHQRLRILRDLGVREVEVSVVDLDEQREKILNVALNRIQGEWDEDRLRGLLAELEQQGADISLTGFTEEELDDLLAELEEATEEAEGNTDPDEVPEPPAEPVTRPGDLWVLGRHRLLCGDATREEDVQRLMGGRLADMVYTDPPYGVAYKGGIGNPRERLAGDEDASLYSLALPLAARYSKPEAPLYLWYADRKSPEVFAALLAAGYEPKAVLIWVKNQAQFGNMAHYHHKHEPLIYAAKRGKKVAWYGPTNEVTVWEVDRARRNDYHPTQKPVELATRATRNSTAPGGLVLDLFGGSGSTLIAAEQVGRACYMMEIEPRYCDVIVRRWEEFTGRKAERVPAEEVTKGR